MPFENTAARLTHKVELLNERLNRIETNEDLSEEMKKKRSDRLNAKLAKINEKIASLSA